MIYAFGVVIGQIWKILNNIWINISRSLSKLNEKTKTKEAFDISSLCVSKQSLHPFVIAQSPPKLNLRPETQTQKAFRVFAQTSESVKILRPDLSMEANDLLSDKVRLFGGERHPCAY